MAWADAGAYITQGRSNEDPLSCRHRAGRAAPRRLRHLRLSWGQWRLLLRPQRGLGPLRRALWKRWLRQLRWPVWQRGLRVSPGLWALQLLAPQLLRLALSLLRVLRPLLRPSHHRAPAPGPRSAAGNPAQCALAQPARRDPGGAPRAPTAGGSPLADAHAGAARTDPAVDPVQPPGGPAQPLFTVARRLVRPYPARRFHAGSRPPIGARPAGPARRPPGPAAGDFTPASAGT